jgi:hypothetical protein
MDPGTLTLSLMMVVAAATDVVVVVATGECGCGGLMVVCG